jgi:serine/threonine protein kinase/Flp pilus assembly protein TadD
MTASAVKRNPGTSADLLFAELVEELTAKFQAGEPVDVEAFLAQHPEQAERLRPLLPALQMLGALSEAGASFPPGDPDQAASAGTLGDFRIVRELGRGGMGVVYEAEQVSLGRRVALKVLPLAATMDPRRLQRFHNEARAAACLHHTNIVPVFAVGCERGVHFYAMQLIEGVTLASVIHDLRQLDQKESAAEGPEGAEKAPTPAIAGITTAQAGRDAAYYRKVAELGVQAAEALDYAHQVGVVHRDVKPGNLMVDERGALWVTDFGLAQIQQGEGSLTLTGDLVGTLRYMSPEQALANREVIDHRTDVYSLGATLYELLTLRPAFEGQDRQELLRQIAFEEPTAPRKLERGIPAELETIVLKALEKNPAQRYASAQELADDLERFLRNEPIRARRPSLGQRLRKWGRRHRAAVTAGAVCLLVSLGVLAGSVGWVLGEQYARQRQAEARVLEALAEAAPGLRQGNPHDSALIVAVQQARAQVNAGQVGPQLRGRVEQLRRDWEMLGWLETARLQGAGSKMGMVDYADADKFYTEAFKRYNLEVTTLDAQEAAERIQRSAIDTHLVAALDDWAFVRDKLQRGAGAALSAVADLADADFWRQRARRARSRCDQAALEKLVDEKGVLQQPPTNLVLLARALWDTRSEAVAERLLRRVQAEHPADFWVHFELAFGLSQRKAPDRAEVVRCYEAALALHRQGRHKAAEAACREAIRLKPDLALAHCHLGNALRDQGRHKEAEAAYRLAIWLNPDFAVAHSNLGTALNSQGRHKEAEAAHRVAIRLQPDSPWWHYHLGVALDGQGRHKEAEAAYRVAIRLNPDPDFPEADIAYLSLGNALKGQDRYKEAAFRQAIRLKADYPEGHVNFGIALSRQGRHKEAETAFRQAIRLKPDFPPAHCNLGQVLLAQGRFAEALEAIRKGHALGSKLPGWPYPSAGWVRDAERLADLDARLPQFLKGEAQPAGDQERLALAQICQQHKQLFAASARWYAEVFAAQPELADALPTRLRYNAACAAALAGCGQGKDAAGLDDKERARLRRQALDWLRADLTAWGKRLPGANPTTRADIATTLAHWQEDTDFAGVRGEPALAKLPETEREPWRKLWADVAATLAATRRETSEKTRTK